MEARLEQTRQSLGRSSSSGPCSGPIPSAPVEQAAFGKWFDQTSDRESARGDRIHGAQGVIPRACGSRSSSWPRIIFVFMLFFADSGERRGGAGDPDRRRVAVIVASMFVIRYLGLAVPRGLGGLQPIAMERTIRTVEQNECCRAHRRAVRRQRQGSHRDMSPPSTTRASAGSSSRRCCWPSPPWPRPGPATRRGSGRESRRRPTAEPTHLASSRPGHRASPTGRPASTSPPSSSGSTPPPTRTRTRDVLPGPVPGRVQAAFDAWIATKP